jgi:hypothetical protein
MGVGLEYFSWENLKRVGFKFSQENFPGKFYELFGEVNLTQTCYSLCQKIIML